MSSFLDVFSLDVNHLISFLLCGVVAVSYIPLLIKSFRTRETQDTSYGFLAFQATEDLLVCLYAWSNLDTILLIGGAISLSPISILTIYKYSRDGCAKRGFTPQTPRTAPCHRHTQYRKSHEAFFPQIESDPEGHPSLHTALT